MTDVRYLVVNLRTEERGMFTTAHDVARYMWGRDFTQYTIYVCYPFPWSNGDVAKFERALEEWA